MKDKIVYVYICMYKHIYVCVHVHLCACTHVYVYGYIVYMCMWVYMCVYVYTYVCGCARMCLCMCVHVCASMCLCIPQQRKVCGQCGREHSLNAKFLCSHTVLALWKLGGAMSLLWTTDWATGVALTSNLRHRRAGVSSLYPLFCSRGRSGIHLWQMQPAGRSLQGSRPGAPSDLPWTWHQPMMC